MDLEEKPQERRRPGAVAEEFQDLLLEFTEVPDFLGALTAYAARALSRAGRPVMCGISARRLRKPAARAASSGAALALDEVQDTAGEGPRFAALRECRSVHVPDLRREKRWPELAVYAAGRGCRSVLVVPVGLEDHLGGTLSFWAPGPAAFAPSDIALAETFAVQASKPLRLALRMGRLREARDDLASAMESRTIIDMAIGVVMAQNRCTPAEGFAFLRSASNSRNIKLRDVAARVVASISGEAEVKAHFEE